MRLWRHCAANSRRSRPLVYTSFIALPLGARKSLDVGAVRYPSIDLVSAEKNHARMERASRGASKAEKAEKAAGALKALREKGLKRIDTVEVNEEDNVYDMVRTTLHAL